MSERNTHTNGYWIWIALALTLAATLWMLITADAAATADEMPIRPVAKKVHSPATTVLAPKIAALNVDQLKRKPLNETLMGDLFGSETVDAAILEIEPVSTVSQVPTLPFTYVGKLEEEEGYIVFLTTGSKNYSVKIGDIVDQWQVKSILSSEMTLNYLPLKYDVSMKLGDIN